MWNMSGNLALSLRNFACLGPEALPPGYISIFSRKNNTSATEIAALQSKHIELAWQTACLAAISLIVFIINFSYFRILFYYSTSLTDPSIQHFRLRHLESRRQLLDVCQLLFLSSLRCPLRW